MVDMCGHLTLVALILGQTGGHLAGGILDRTSLPLVQHRIPVNNLAGPSAEVHHGWQLHSSTPTSIHRSGIYLAGATIHFGFHRFMHHIQQLPSSEHLATPIHRGCALHLFGIATRFMASASISNPLGRINTPVLLALSQHLYLGVWNISYMVQPE